MSANETLLRDHAFCMKVINLYTGADKPNLRDVAEKMGTTYHTVKCAVDRHLPEDVKRREKSLRYSRGKIGSLNPMHGRKLDQHHNFKGVLTFGGKGYPIKKTEDGKYRLMHHLVICEALGLSGIPKGFIVHHVDGNVQNFQLSNLALMSVAAHRRIHAHQPLLKLSLWEKETCGISR